MSNIVPFGKYKDQPVEQMLTDRNYVDWLLCQPWFQEKYITIYNVVSGGGNEPTSTPEHNRMQIRFLDWEYRQQFIRLCMPKWRCEAPPDDITKERNITKFEVSGIDVAIVQTWRVTPPDFLKKTVECDQLEISAKGLRNCSCPVIKYQKKCSCLEEAWKIESVVSRARTSLSDSVRHHRLELAVELKPTIGDDFPEVMRQIKRRWQIVCASRYGDAVEMFGSYGPGPGQVLVVGEYTGVGATVEQFIEFFRNENIDVMFEYEIKPPMLLLPPPY